MHDEPFCFWHAPETAEEAAEARRQGGLNRRKRKTVSAIFGFRGLRTIEDNQALLETAAIETLLLPNSIPRNRVIAQIASTGAKLIEVGDHEERIAALEAATRRTTEPVDDGFDDLT